MAKLVKGAQGGLPVADKLGLAPREEVGEARAVDHSLHRQGEAREIGDGDAGGLEGRHLKVELVIENARLDGDDSSETPVDAGELAGEVVLDAVEGADDGDESGDAILESRGVLIREDDGVGAVAAVLESVERRASLTGRRLGATRFGAVDAGLSGTRDRHRRDVRVLLPRAGYHGS